MDDKWQNKTGHAFELAVKSWFSTNKYNVQDMDVRNDKGGRKNWMRRYRVVMAIH